MRLGQFISRNSDRIIQEWEKFAATRLPAASSMSLGERRDHIGAILRRISADLAKPQTRKQQSDKSKGESDARVGEDTGARSHGSARAESGYSADQMVSEFRALRACIVRLWTEELDEHDRHAFDDLTRFHEAIDQALAESLETFNHDVDRAKDLFLGILGHDLRTPLAAVMMGATMMITEEAPDWSHAKTASRILSSGTRMEEIIRDLLDFTRARLGGGIPVTRDEIDLDALLRQTIDELAAAHSRCPISFQSTGPVIGMWDRARIGQVVANLIGNACQHGAAGEPIEITVGVEEEAVVLAIHNKGTMIAPQHLQTIFEPFRRLDEDKPRNRANSVGLGLYIAQAIVVAHQGTIEATSTQHRTTFTVRLPRQAERM